MKTSTVVWIIVILVVIAGGWYWWSAYSANQAPATTPTSTTSDNAPMQPAQSQTSTTTTQGDGTSPSQNLTLGLDTSASLGQYLIAYNGMTLYTYDKDTAGVSNCTGSCATNWPPYTTTTGSALNLEAGVSGQIGLITRTDGTTQVTYKGMPLYFYIGDKISGDTTGDGVGGVWHVARP